MFAGLAFQDTTEIILQGLNKKNKRIDVSFNLQLVDTLQIDPNPLYGGRNVYLSDSLSEDMQKYFSTLRQKIQLQSIQDSIAQYELEVVEITSRSNKADGIITSYYEPDYSVKGKDLAQNLTVLESLQGRIPGVQIQGTRYNMRVFIRGIRGLSNNVTNEVLYILDGIPTTIDIIQTIPMPDIYRVDVLKTPAQTAVYGVRGANGVIAVYTKAEYNDTYETDIPDDIGMMRPNLKGFHISRNFYLPKYTPDQAVETVDLRSTLYWNPLIRTDAKGKASLSFYNSDLKGEFVITVEGISILGKPGYATTTFTVR